MTKSPEIYRETIVDILVQAFHDNPTLKAFTGFNHSGRVRDIIEYSYDYSLHRNGVLLSDEKTCTALFFKNSNTSGSISESYKKIKLIFTAIPFRKLLAILFHLRHIKSSRGSIKEFYYLWYLGACPQSPASGTRKFIQEIFDIANSERLPIYAETTLLKNRFVFERYGFETYNIWYNKRLNITVYFMRKNAA